MDRDGDGGGHSNRDRHKRRDPDERRYFLAFGAEVWRSPNAQRQANGCATPLVYNQKLWNAAQRFAYLASNAYLSHTGKDGSTMVSRVEAEEHTWTALAENVAAGYGTPHFRRHGLDGERRPPAPISSTATTEVGVGYYYIFPDPNPTTNHRFYWVVDFGRP
ncbi:MAG: CAP domain-containing protein [Thermomicrobiales bacterium]